VLAKGKQFLSLLRNPPCYSFCQEEFEDTKGAIRIRISKKDREHNGQKKKDKGQTTINKTNPTKTGGELRFSGRVCSSCSTSDNRRVNLVTNPMINHEPGKDREVFTTSGTYPWSSHVILFKQNLHGTLFTVFSSYPLLLFSVAFAYIMFVE